MFLNFHSYEKLFNEPPHCGCRPLNSKRKKKLILTKIFRFLINEKFWLIINRPDINSKLHIIKFEIDYKLTCVPN